MRQAILNYNHINSVYNKLESWLPKTIHLINISFLNAANKFKYKKIITQRVNLIRKK